MIEGLRKWFELKGTACFGVQSNALCLLGEISWSLGHLWHWPLSMRALKQTSHLTIIKQVSIKTVGSLEDGLTVFNVHYVLWRPRSGRQSFEIIFEGYSWLRTDQNFLLCRGQVTIIFLLSPVLRLQFGQLLHLVLYVRHLLSVLVCATQRISWSISHN